MPILSPFRPRPTESTRHRQIEFAVLVILLLTVVAGVALYYEPTRETFKAARGRDDGSHVTEYGNEGSRFKIIWPRMGGVINQRRDDLIWPWIMYESAREAENKEKWLKDIRDQILHRQHLDDSIDIIGFLLFGSLESRPVLYSRIRHDLPLTDDAICLRSMIMKLQAYCGPFTSYDLERIRSLANICNAGVSLPRMDDACKVACGDLTLLDRFLKPREYNAKIVNYVGF